MMQDTLHTKKRRNSSNKIELIFKGAIRVACRREAFGRARAHICQQAGLDEFSTRQRNSRRPKLAHDPRPHLAHPGMFGSERRRRQRRPQLDQQEHTEKKKVDLSHPHIHTYIHSTSHEQA